MPEETFFDFCLEAFRPALNIEVEAEFFNVEVVDEFSNIEVVDEFFNVKVVDEVFVFAAIRLLLRGCRPLHILQGSRSQSLYICLNETFPLSSCSQP